MITKANEIEEKFLNYLDKLYKSSDIDYYYDYDYQGLNIEYIKEEILKNKDKLSDFICFLNESGEITNFAYFIEMNDLNLFELDFADNEILKNNIEELKKNYTRPIITDCIDVDELDVYKMNKKSDKTGEEYNYYRNYYCLNKEDINLLVQKSDELNFPEYTNNLTFKVVNHNDFINDNLRNDRLLATSMIKENNFCVVAGFHYLDTTPSKNDKLLLALDNGNVVDCIKYGIYGDNKTEPENLAICYIDVKKPFRNKGIATRLFEEFSNVVKEENKERIYPLPVYLTQESDLGKQCNMRKIALEKIKDAICYYCDDYNFKYISYLNNEEIASGNLLRDCLPYLPNKEKNVENIR